MSERRRERDQDQAQLRLLSGRERTPEWVLDEQTRTAGLRGVAEARAILRRAQPPAPKKQPEPVRKAS
jgi:hypothetical protein